MAKTSSKVGHCSDMAKGVAVGRMENRTINIIKHIFKYKSEFVPRVMCRNLSNLLYHVEH